jgi:hypothetical protein
MAKTRTPLWYRPIGMASGVVAGAVAGALFKRTWQAIADEDDAPDAVDERRSWTEVLLAATIQGAVFALVKAAVDRGSATAVRRITGTWPAH